MDIRMVKLTSGEAVLSEVEFKTSLSRGECIILYDPHILAPTPQGIALVPWILGSEGPYEIGLENVMTTGDPMPEAINIYKQQTGKGVIETL